MTTDPLTTTVVDLDAALGGSAGLLLGGGLGLLLKQQHLLRSGDKTNLPRDKWPQARTTQDIDLFLRVEVVADKAEMGRYREALDSLGFVVEEGAKWMKFGRVVAGQHVLLDLMVGPLGDLAGKIERRGVRAKPIDSSGLHARTADDALAVDQDPVRLPLQGGTRSCDVLIPQAFSFALMKLGALRDRIRDTNKDEGRHHALDLYRIAAMLTEPEEATARQAAAKHQGHPVITQAGTAIDRLLADPRGLGRIRLREHPLCPGHADPDWLTTELRNLLSP